MHDGVMQKRLVELLCAVACKGDDRREGGCGLRRDERCARIEQLEMCMIECIADHLLDSGAIVPLFKAGDHIWVIDREDGKAIDVSCVQYMANCKNCVIATAFVNDYDFDETLEYHINETQERFDTELKVYPEEDCFPTREEAEKALAEREGKG